METIGIIGVILGLYRDNKKENGNYRDNRASILGTSQVDGPRRAYGI